jgi:hypothetical protein
MGVPFQSMIVLRFGLLLFIGTKIMVNRKYQGKRRGKLKKVVLSNGLPLLNTTIILKNNMKWIYLSDINRVIVWGWKMRCRLQ